MFSSRRNTTGYIRDQCCHLPTDGASLLALSFEPRTAELGARMLPLSRVVIATAGHCCNCCCSCWECSSCPCCCNIVFVDDVGADDVAQVIFVVTIMECIWATFPATVVIVVLVVVAINIITWSRCFFYFCNYCSCCCYFGCFCCCCCCYSWKRRGAFDE